MKHILAVDENRTPRAVFLNAPIQKKKEDGKTQIYKMYEEKKVHLYGILYTYRCKISLPFPINPIHPV